MKPRLVATTASVAMVAGFSQPGWAQSQHGGDVASGLQATGAASSTPRADARATVPAEARPDEIVVTGSRIARTEFDAPNPITSFNAAAITDSGRTNLTEFLQRVPALIGSSGNFDNSGIAKADQVGLDLLDLRHLGTARTLVLVDGRGRVASQPNTAAVDINSIPTELVSRETC